MSIGKKVAATFILLGTVLSAGCARFPSGSTAVSGTQLVITMTVQGRINPNYYYFVAIDNDGDDSNGPVAIAGPPWGNGWGGGSITSYVLFHRTEPQGFSVYQIVPNTDLLESRYLAPPISFDPVQNDTTTLKFTIDLSQIQTAAIPTDQIQTLNINFINVTEPVLDPNYPNPRPYDGLGDLGTDYVTIPVTTPRTFRNSTERPGDVIDPDLDIVDWQIQVQKF